MLSYESISPADAAHRAADLIIGNPPEADHLYTHEELFALAGIPELRGFQTKRDFQAERFWYAEFKDRLDDLLRGALGRPLVNVYGEGYRLIGVNQATQVDHDQMFHSVLRPLRKFATKSQKTNLDYADAMERQRRLDAMAQTGQLENLVRREQQQGLLPASSCKKKP